MTQTVNTTTETRTAITAFVSDANGNSSQATFLCKMNSTDIETAERVVYTINTLYQGSHRSGDGDDYSDFGSAWDALTTYFNEADSSNADDFPETDREVEALLNRGKEFQVKIGEGLYLCLAKTTVAELLVDAPIYEDGDGREVVICYEETSDQFVVQVKNLNGQFSVCTLDGEVFSSARSWFVLDRVPESVRKEVEAVWEVSAEGLAE